jgi:SAM-dependent MidA family methyltransferase
MNERDAMKRNPASLVERLRERIRRESAITFRDWMAAALYDESEGYYRRSDRARWGRAGDYRTSPERSPLFAATFARYFAKLYQELGSPAQLTIVEAGAGAGHFAHGVLETLQRSSPHVFNATRYLIDETSADTRERVRERLRTFAGRVEFLRLNEIEVPINAGLVFSNELLDAMPVHRVIAREGKLLELCVGLNDAGEFIWTERETTTPRLAAYFDELGVHLADGQIAEVSLAAGDWLCRVAAKLDCGYIITVDYGAEPQELYGVPHRMGGTLRAFREHRFAGNVLSSPGEQDITTTVDWTHIKRTGEKCGLETALFERQDRFLLGAGALDQLELMAAETSNEAERVILHASAREMILPGGMSESFQVLVQKRKA